MKEDLKFFNWGFGRRYVFPLVLWLVRSHNAALESAQACMWLSGMSELAPLGRVLIMSSQVGIHQHGIDSVGVRDLGGPGASGRHDGDHGRRTRPPISVRGAVQAKSCEFAGEDTGSPRVIRNCVHCVTDIITPGYNTSPFVLLVCALADG